MKLTLTEIDRDPTPLGTLVLSRYEAPTGEFGHQIEIDGEFLMATHGCHSERALAPLARARLRRPASDLSVLVGGLGAGHTLRAALDLPGVASVTVAEIGARMADWNRSYFAEANGHAVDDPRVRVVVADLWDVLRTSKGSFDLLLLDVDNGPERLAATGNARLYDASGVLLCRDALRDGGVAAFWSGARNPLFLATLRAIFMDAEEIDTREIAREVGEINDVVYLGRRVPGTGLRPGRTACPL
jgi:spermidine synthase